MLMLPDVGERLGNVELAKADRIVSGNVELQVVARGEGNLFRCIQRFENQLLDEGGDVAVTDDA
jgi:hypothetical protein